MEQLGNTMRQIAVKDTDGEVAYIVLIADNFQLMRHQLYPL